jgi:Icc-related predicted phosphoesterase
MQILVISDLHGDLDSAHAAARFVRPDMILSCGDWGDPEEVDESKLNGLLAVAPIYTTFGNHDPLDLLEQKHNLDGSAVLLPQGQAVKIAGVRLAAIGGIWAKSHAKRHYVTDADVADAAARIAQSGPIDILITHGCPVGLADMTPTGRHGGQRCFLEAFQTISPRLHLCGHLHVPQERVLKDGRRIINVGETPTGSMVVIDFDAASGTMNARLETFAPLRTGGQGE